MNLFTNDIVLNARQMSDVAARNTVLTKELMQVCFDADSDTLPRSDAVVRISNVSTTDTLHYVVNVPDISQDTGEIWDYELRLTAELDRHASSPVKDASTTAKRRVFDTSSDTWTKEAVISDRRLIQPVIRALQAVGVGVTMPEDHSLQSRGEVATLDKTVIEQEVYEANVDFGLEVVSSDTTSVTL